MIRKDATRPLVRCDACRYFIPGERLCPVARKVFFPERFSTCKRFSSAAIHPRTHLEELQARLAAAGLADTVTEMGEDEFGRVFIRFAFGVGVEGMRSVVGVVVD